MATGLAFAFVGMQAERRALLPAIYGGLTLQNGVPIGYVQLDILGRHAELSFNQFETFRHGGAARVFARFIAATHHVFGCDSFSIEPYQLGDGNDEGIESGAWWFYRRFGFEPRAKSARDGSASRTRAWRGIPRIEVRSACCACSRARIFSSRSRPSDRRDCHGSTRSLRLPIMQLRRFTQREAADRSAAATAAARKLAPRRPTAPVGGTHARKMGGPCARSCIATAAGAAATAERCSQSSARKRA